ncbi:MAG: metallophosphoesterase [Pirellula sp.]
MFDLIGDIHGHADALVTLLGRLGYTRIGGVFRHADRKVVFLGDFIDRGPQIREVLEIVRPMVEKGHALAIMGNHEFNALAYHTPHRDAPNSNGHGAFLRPRSAKNQKQHHATLDQLTSEQLRSYLSWFRTLPLWLELDGIRAVHACWDVEAMDRIVEAGVLRDGVSDDFLHDACCPEGPLIDAVEVLLKGKECRLPQGVVFQDKEGHSRTVMRTRWYENPSGHTYRTYAFQSAAIDCDLELDRSVIAAAEPYPDRAKPVFIGHYWLSAQQPSVLAPNVACLDYSVAKGGFLCAYRWSGENRLQDENFVW